MTSRRLRARRLALLTALLALFGGLKLAFDPPLGRSQDGDYYYQIARNVSEGNGLATHVSLYHQGLPRFPHPVNQNPLWLLMLGALGALFGLRASATVVPEWLYLVDLVLLYSLARMIGARCGARLPGDRLGIDLGHIAVALFGANALFFRFTSLPYTEGLAFALLFATLLATERAGATRSYRWAALCGLLAGLALLTRVQMLGAVAAIPVAFAWVGLRDRRFAGMAAAAVVGAGVVWLPWTVYVIDWVGSTDPLTVLGLARIQATHELAPLQATTIANSLWGDVIDRLRGVWVSLDPRDSKSYVASFGWVTYLVPLAGIRWATAGSTWRRRMATLRDLDVFVLATLLCGMALLVPIHLLHFSSFQPWLFSWRHGLPLVLLLVPALGFLLARGGTALRILTVALVVASLASGLTSLKREFDRDYPPDLLGPESRALAWLDGQSPLPAVVTTQAARLSVFSRSGFHWTRCDEPAAQTRALLRHAGANYVLVYGREESCPFVSALASELTEVHRSGDGRNRVSIYAPREGF